MTAPVYSSSKTILRVGIAVGCLISVATAAALQSDSGLQGILPTEVPGDLYYEEFEFSQENWQPWGEEVAFLLADLYEDDSLDVSGQRELINQLNAKLEKMQGYLSDQAYAAVFDDLSRLRGRILRRVRLAEAILDTLELSPEKVLEEKREGLLAGVKSSVQEIKSSFRSKGTPGVDAWYGYFQTEGLSNLTLESENVKELLTDVQVLFAKREELGEVQLTFVNENFLGLSAAINTALEEWDVNPVEGFSLEKLREDLRGLVEAVELYEETGHEKDAAALRELVTTFGASSLDKGELIRKVLRDHYMNYNVIVQVSEQFMSKLVSDPQRQSKPISDSVGGARVSGTSNTSYDQKIDLKPSTNGVFFDIMTSGTVNTNTTSRTSQATIRTAGNHTFSARQRIEFDGDRMTLQGSAGIDVNPSFRTTGISTVADGGIFANVGRQRAREAIAARLPQARERARSKIRNEVLPEFNRKTAEAITKMNQKLDEDLLTPLREKDLFPVARYLSSTESIMQSSNNLMPENKLGGDVPNITLPYMEGALIQIHESAINNVLGKLELAGREMTLAEVQAEVESKLSSFLGKGFKFSEGEKSAEEGEGEKEETVFIFDEHDPIRVEFAANEFRLIIRTGFKREGKENIETNVITIPIRISLEGEQMVLEHGNIVPVPASGKLSIAQTNVIKKKMNDAFPKRTRSSRIEREKSNGGKISVLITDMKALNGWMSVKIK